MIASHQPDNLSPNVHAVFTSAEDGSIAAGAGNEPTQEHRQNGWRVLENNGFSADSNTLLFITYGHDRSYRDIERVTQDNAGQPITADALFTTERNVPIFLPVADCIPTIVEDTRIPALGVLHLGRHASVNHLIEHYAERVRQELGSVPEDWRVWMGPSLQAASNRLEYFTPSSPDEWEPFIKKRGKQLLVDIPAHNRERFKALGVNPKNISVSSVDTYTDERYFSHRAAHELKRPERQGRMALAAMLNV